MCCHCHHHEWYPWDWPEPGPPRRRRYAPWWREEDVQWLEEERDALARRLRRLEAELEALREQTRSAEK
jgi:hypothetical protein